jgi:DNA-binding CsgD family transcriptional regulator
LVILDQRGGVEAVSQAAERWLQEVVDLPATTARPLPHPVYAVAGRAAASGDLARLRLRTRSGGWLALHASRLEGRRESRLIGVVVEPAPTVEMASVIVAAYGFTDRERVVAELVLRGRSTKEIAAELRVSAYTVNDHLRAVFDKAGVRSRGELTVRIFLDHYLPGLVSGAQPGGTTAGVTVPGTT